MTYNNNCNVWVLGNNASGKTSLISRLVKNEDFISYETINYYQTDWQIIDREYSVTVEFKESSFSLKTNSLNLIENKFTDKSIFIIIINPEIENPEKIYDNYWINVVKELSPSSIVLIVFNTKNKIKSNLIDYNKLRAKNSTIRDIFAISDFFNNGFSEFKFILKNIIINKFTDRLNNVNKKIRENLLFKEKALDIGKCDLTSLYEVPLLFDCVHLETLIISNEWAEFKNNKWYKKESDNYGNNNNLGILPFEIKRLKNLKIIIAGGDWNINSKLWLRWRIYDITPLINLSSLEYINFSNNLITKIPNLSKLENLKILHLNNNEITKVFRDINFNNLTEFYLSNNKLKNITFANNLINISTLDLHGNEIKDLEPLRQLIEKLNISNSKWEKHTINIAKNPLEKPPMEIINTGKDAVLNYFKDITLGKNFINKDVKLILVGNSEVGKSTLVKYLDNERDLDKSHPATHWMVEKSVTSKHILSKIKQKCTINVFDFGGHDYFHDTHHLFYGSNTVYLLLWDKNTNHLNLRKTIQNNSNGKNHEVEFQDYPLKYWLDSIKHFIKEKESENFDFQNKKESEYNSDVLIIQNKVERNEELVHLNNQKLKSDYSFIYDFTNISIINKKRNLDFFDSILIEMLNNTPIIGAKLPSYYGIIKGNLESYNHNPILSLNEFLSYCNSILTIRLTLNQVKYLASYLKQIGTILYYPDSKNNDKVYINKKWIIDKIYKILQGLSQKKGEFNKLYLDEIFKTTLSKKQKNDIINLMIDFKIIFCHPNSDTYIAPLYLPIKPLNSVSLFLDDNILPFRRFIYSGFIHKSVILNFFQEYGKLVIKENQSGNNDLYYYWKDGLIIKDIETNEIVKIEFNLGNNEGNAYIDIVKINNPNKSEFVNTIINYIIEINKDYEIEEMFTLDGIDYISVELLNQFAKEGKLIFTEKKLKDRDKQEKEKIKFFELKNYTMVIEETIKKKKVVISYSKKDLTRVHTFLRYLNPLIDLELIEQPWYCTLMNPADEWDDKIQAKFDEADIIFFMVSEYFYSTKYIVDKEIKNAINRYDKDKSVKIVPIILEHYEWGRKAPYNLQRFSALPFQAKPISDFNNEKIAWNTITTSVKVMIEKDLDPGQIELISRDLQEIYERQVEGKLDNNSK